MPANPPSSLFDPVTLRSTILRNRLMVSPMCQYSAHDGEATDYHLAHLARFAMGGFGLVMLEATAIAPIGRLTYGDVGLWSDQQIAPIARIVDAVHDAGGAFGVQIAHAGPKAGTLPPWVSEADRPAGGAWKPVSVTSEPYAAGWSVPTALSVEALDMQLDDWRAAAARALATGADVLELHMAHGYLLHAFLSPHSNSRDDLYGGSMTRRFEYPLRVARAVREVWPQDRALMVRISVVDNDDDGIGLAQSVEFSRRLKAEGVDVIDCSSGGYGPGYSHSLVPGYQVGWAEAVRTEADVATVAVGLIVDAEQAEAIVREGRADIVALGREALIDPAWPLRAHAAIAPADIDGRTDLMTVQTRGWIAKRQRLLDRLAPVSSPTSGSTSD